MISFEAHPSHIVSVHVKSHVFFVFECRFLKGQMIKEMKRGEVKKFFKFSKYIDTFKKTKQKRFSVKSITAII